MSDSDLAELYQRRRRELGLDARPQAAVASATQIVTVACRLCGKARSIDWPANVPPPRLRPALCGDCRRIEDQRHQQEQRDTAEGARRAALEAVRSNLPAVLARCGVPAHFVGARFDACPDVPAKLIAAVRGWVDRPKGIALLYGVPGAGKTWCAVAAVAHVLHAGTLTPVGCRFISESGYLDVLKAGFGKGEVSPRLLPASDPRRVKLLVFDEIGGSALTEWGRGEVGRLVAERHGADLATILTSNLDLDGLARAVDPRIASRIAESRMVLEFPRRDLRIAGTV